MSYLVSISYPPLFPLHLSYPQVNRRIISNLLQEPLFDLLFLQWRLRIHTYHWLGTIFTVFMVWPRVPLLQFLWSQSPTYTVCQEKITLCDNMLLHWNDKKNSPLNSTSTMCDFINYSIDCIWVWDLYLEIFALHQSQKTPQMRCCFCWSCVSYIFVLKNVHFTMDHQQQQKNN